MEARKPRPSRTPPESLLSQENRFPYGGNSREIPGLFRDPQFLADLDQVGIAQDVSVGLEDLRIQTRLSLNALGQPAERIPALNDVGRLFRRSWRRRGRDLRRG